MTLDLALIITSYLVGFALFLGAVELLLISRNKLFSAVWSFDNLRGELKSKIFSLAGFRVLLVLQALFSISLYFFQSPLTVGLLLLTHVLVCIRFRGTFNGGSDMMTVVVLTGLLIAFCGYERAGLIYIAIHTLFSYFKAGLVKLKQSDWRQGRAIPEFMRRSIFVDVRNLKVPCSQYLAWALIGFELSSLLLLIQPDLVWAYFVIAVFFHFINYLVFGLNRFFWIWLAAWPAVIYTTGLI